MTSAAPSTPVSTARLGQVTVVRLSGDSDELVAFLDGLPSSRLPGLIAIETDVPVPRPRKRRALPLR